MKGAGLCLKKALAWVGLRNLKLQAYQGRTNNGRHGGVLRALQRALSRGVGSLLGGERGPAPPFSRRGSAEAASDMASSSRGVATEGGPGGKLVAPTPAPG